MPAPFVTDQPLDLLQRTRRLRTSPGMRQLVQETHLRAQHLVAPFFLTHHPEEEGPIPSFFDVCRYTPENLLHHIPPLLRKGVQSVMLFPYVDGAVRSPRGAVAYTSENVLLTAIPLLKREFPSLVIMADIALDPFTSHGHDGVVDESGRVPNDESVHALADLALLYAQVGCDVVAPSDMMDGRVKAIRDKLDAHGYVDVAILAYTAKYLSNLYGPFRDVLGTRSLLADKATYFLNPTNAREALREAALDEAEGADILMVKPALFYLDILARFRSATNLPLCAYHVSGEYAMVMAAHERGCLNAEAVFWEALLTIRRAGADCIISYAIPHILNRL